jgi:hypothetical protein
LGRRTAIAHFQAFLQCLAQQLAGTIGNEVYVDGRQFALRHTGFTGGCRHIHRLKAAAGQRRAGGPGQQLPARHPSARRLGWLDLG